MSDGIDTTTARQRLDGVRQRLAEMDTEVDNDADPAIRPLRALLRVQDALSGAGYAAAIGDEATVAELLAIVARWSVFLLTETPADEEAHDALTLLNGVYAAAVSGDDDVMSALTAVEVDELGSTGLAMTPAVPSAAVAVTALAAGRPVPSAPTVPGDPVEAYWALQAVAASAFSEGDEQAATAALNRLHTVYDLVYSTPDLQGDPSRFLRLPERGLRALGRRASSSS